MLDKIISALSQVPANYSAHSAQMNAMLQIFAFAVILIAIPLVIIEIKKSIARKLLWRDIKQQKELGLSYREVRRILSDDKNVSRHLGYLAKKRGKQNIQVCREDAVISLLKRKGVYSSRSSSKEELVLSQA